MKLLEITENKLGRDFVVGDIHGSYTLLMNKLKELDFDFNNDRLFSVGDLVNKGHQSLRVLDLLEKEWFYPVLGNHEQIIIENYKYGWYPKHLYKYNGFWFVQLNHYAKEMVVEMFEKIPAAIELTIGDKKVGIVHAEVPDNDWDLFKQKLNGANDEIAYKYMTNAMWSRSKIDHLDRTLVKGIHTVFVGHTILNEAGKLGNTCYIDTGAFSTGNITIINLTNFLKD